MLSKYTVKPVQFGRSKRKFLQNSELFGIWKARHHGVLVKDYGVRFRLDPGVYT